MIKPWKPERHKQQIIFNNYDEKNVPCMMHNGSDSILFWILRRRGGAQPMPPVPQNEPCRHQPEYIPSAENGINRSS